MLKRLLLATGLLVISLQASSALASSQVIDLTGVVPSVAEVEEGLLPDQACAQLRQSGFKCMGFKPAVRFSMPSSYFDIGSAQLPEELQKQLDVFAQVIKKVDSGQFTFVVTGHADASGSEAINQGLSVARARAVKQYLASQGVNPDVLVTQGMGASNPADPLNPYAAKNRRIEIGRGD